MTLPEFVRRFWYAATELGQRTERTAWGAIASDDRYPLVWDANNATVLETAEGLNEAHAQELAGRGFKFCGPTIVYAFMQAIGMVNDHLVSCHRHAACIELAER